MGISQIHHIITTPRSPRLTAKTGVWFGLSLAIALLFAWIALQAGLGHEGLSGDRLVQDDARQYVFWMQRFQEPGLFPQDLIADYFQSVTPLGYIALYRLGAALGIDPFTFNKVIPVALSLVTTGYFFWLVMAIVPLPFTSWLACLLLNHTLWMKDDLVSATPRSFVYPLFLAFLYYLLDVRQLEGQQLKTQKSMSQRPNYPESSRQALQASGRSLLGGSLALGLLGFFYPQYVLVAAGMVVLMLLGRGWSQWQTPTDTSSRTPDRASFHLLIYLGIAIAVIAFYAFTASDYDPVVTVEQAKTMPEFWPGGRSFFFSNNLWWFYAVGDRSGFLHVGLVRPASLCFGVFLPVMLWRYRSVTVSNPILQTLTPHLSLIGTLLLSASGWFVLAHLLLFRLHLPSRYTDHSLRIILAIAAAIVLTVILEWLIRVAIKALGASTRRESPVPPSSEQRLRQSRLSRRAEGGGVDHQLDNAHISRRTRASGKGAIALVAAAVLMLLVVIYPVFVKDFPLTKYKRGNAPQLYDFFRQQPKDVLVASLAEEVNNLPVFAQRSILVGREYAIPYHLGYYNEFRDRAIALIRAQYSPNRADVVTFIADYRIDFWMLDADAFEEDYLTNRWTHQYLEAVKSAFGNSANLDLAQTPALTSAIQPCTVAREGSRRVLEAQCIAENL